MQLILRKIIETVATRCRILKLKCTKLQRLPGHLAGFKGPTSEGREGRKDGRERQELGKGRGR